MARKKFIETYLMSFPQPLASSRYLECLQCNDHLHPEIKIDSFFLALFIETLPRILERHKNIPDAELEITFYCLERNFFVLNIEKELEKRKSWMIGRIAGNLNNLADELKHLVKYATTVAKWLYNNSQTDQKPKILTDCPEWFDFARSCCFLSVTHDKVEFADPSWLSYFYCLNFNDAEKSNLKDCLRFGKKRMEDILLSSPVEKK